jgi:arginase family enzyme
MDREIQDYWIEAQERPSYYMADDLGLARYGQPRIDANTPSFLEVPIACEAGDLEGADVAIIGIRGGAYNTPVMHQVAEHLGITVFTMGDIERLGMQRVLDHALEVITRGTDRVYVSLDVDSIEPVDFPAQKYPDPFGLTARQVRNSLRRLTSETNLAGFDIACVGPAYDYKGLSGITATKFVLEILKGLALKKGA